MDHRYLPGPTGKWCAHVGADAATCGLPPTAHGVTHVAAGEVMASHVTTNLPPDASAITVGPDEVLIIRTPHILTQRQIDDHRATIEGALGPDRYVLLMGDWTLGKAAIRDAMGPGTVVTQYPPPPGTGVDRSPTEYRRGAPPRELRALDADKLVGPVANCVSCGQGTTEYCAHCRVAACPLHDRIRGLGSSGFVHIRPAPQASLPCEPATPWIDLGHTDSPVELAAWPPGWKPLGALKDDAKAWRPGDPCVSCGSTNTAVTHNGLAVCRACGRTDADET